MALEVPSQHHLQVGIVHCDKSLSYDHHIQLGYSGVAKYILPCIGLESNLVITPYKLSI